jgi:uncharacterized membrane protein
MAPDAKVTPARWIRMGWHIVKEDLGNFVLIALIAGALSIVGSFVVTGPLLAGMFIAVRRRITEGRTDVMDLFIGFHYFLDALLIHILTLVFSIAGLILFIFPVFIVIALYPFSYLFLIDRKLAFWDAMESSRKAALQNLAKYVGFTLLLLLLNVVGLMLLGVGLLVTVPVTIAAITVAYNETVGIASAQPQAQGPIVIP